MVKLRILGNFCALVVNRCYTNSPEGMLGETKNNEKIKFIWNVVEKSLSGP